MMPRFLFVLILNNRPPIVEIMACGVGGLLNADD
jgi:hypothetical protein